MSTSQDSPAPTTPKVAYAVFCGPTNEATAQRLALVLATCTQKKIEHVHLLFQSSGGFVGDGIFIYNILKSLPIELTIYNGGQISSAGVTAFLGAPRRKISPYGTFMIHRCSHTPDPATARNLIHSAKIATIEDERTGAILREHIQLPDELWTAMQFHDLYLSAQDALDYGLVDEIVDFAPPRGAEIYSLIS